MLYAIWSTSYCVVFYKVPSSYSCSVHDYMWSDDIASYPVSFLFIYFYGYVSQNIIISINEIHASNVYNWLELTIGEGSKMCANMSPDPCACA